MIFFFLFVIWFFKYLSALLWNRKQLNGKYEKSALVIRDDFSTPMLDSISKLEKVWFEFGKNWREKNFSKGSFNQAG